MSTGALKKPATVEVPGAGADQILCGNQNIADSRLIVNAKDHLEFLHESSHPSGFAHIWIKDGEDNEKQFLYRKVGALDNWKILEDMEGQEDIYVAINPLYRPYRKNDNVSDINWVWVDLDAPKDAPHDWAYETSLKVETDIFGKGLLPQPNARVSSGRGVWYLWSIERVSTQYPPDLEAWRRIMDHFVRVLRPYNADLGAKDEARLMRLAGTINSNSGRTVSIQILHQHRYHITEITERYLPAIRKSRRGESTRKPTKAKGTPRKAPAGGRTIATLIRNRMSDIEDLVAMREGHMTGYRNETIFIYAVHAFASGCDLEEARQKVIQLNETFSDPLSANEVIKTLKSAEQHASNEKYKLYTNAKIIDKLAITPEEQESLSAIIDKDEKRRRDRERKRKARRGVSRAEWEADNLKKRMKKLAELRKALAENPGASVRELAKITGFSKSTVQRLRSLL